MGSHPKKRALDKTGRDSILSCTAGFLTSHPEILAAYKYTVIREGTLFLDRDPNRRADFKGNVIKQFQHSKSYKNPVG